MTKFSYKIDYSLNLKSYLIPFYWKWILINPSLASSYIPYTCKTFRKLNINSYVINKFFKLQVFYNLKLYIKYKLIDHIVNNIQLTQNLTYVLMA